MTRNVKKINLLFLLFIFHSILFAEVSDSDKASAFILQEQTYIQNQKELDAINNNLNLEIRDKNPDPLSVPLQELKKDTMENLPSFMITSIEIEGANRLSGKKLKHLKKHYLNRRLNQIDISNLLKSITNLYLEKGYITSRATLPEQDLSQGTLIICVIEGKIGNIQFLNLNEDKKFLFTSFTLQ